MLVNAGESAVTFVLPPPAGSTWRLELTTGDEAQPLVLPPGSAAVVRASRV